MQFDHHTTSIYINDHPYKTAEDRIREAVNHYGSEGYELASIVPAIESTGETHQLSGYYILVFKRPKAA